MSRKIPMPRRAVFAGGVVLGGALSASTGRLLRSGRAQTAVTAEGRHPRPHLTLPDIREDQIADIKVCLRPFRPQGPRYDVETIGDRTVFHHYGHGGSGWSLSWGSADFVVGRVAATLEKRIAVIGCGIIGLTTALTAQRAGMDVTIYTRDLLPQTRSVRANGSWTPDSRIALTHAVDPAFPDLWERMARFSWATYRSYLGLPGDPVMFLDTYRLGDTPADIGETETGNKDANPAPRTGATPTSEDFARYGARIGDTVPHGIDIPPDEIPFPVAYARHVPLMIYNFSSYGAQLMAEFHQAGGRIVMREFHTPAELRALPERVIVNCPGLAARDWWKDRSLVPVRGQTNWLPPAQGPGFGVSYRGAELLCKRDGVMIQGYDLDGLGDAAGVGNGFEHPDRAEAQRAIGIFNTLFARREA